MKKIEDLWQLLKDVELVQVRPIEMEALYKHCFEFKNPEIVEIGSAHGASSIILAEAAKELNGYLTCIDSFPEDYYGQDKFGSYGKEQFIKNVKDYRGECLSFINLPSNEAIAKAKKDYKDWACYGIDVLFVDGNHDYEAVKDDCNNYLPLLNHGGYVGFHDYYNVSFGVQKAVDETIGEGYEGPFQYWDLAVFKKL